MQRGLTLSLRVVVLLILGCETASRTQPRESDRPEHANTGWSLAIATRQSTYESTDVMVADITLTNISNAEMRIPEGMRPLRAYNVRVVFNDSEAVPHTRLGKREHLRSLVASPMYLAPVAPGGTFRATLDLSSLFDFSLPGIYRVEVSRGVPEGGTGRTTLVSGSIAVVVTEPGKSGR